VDEQPYLELRMKKLEVDNEYSPFKGNPND
jgi:hypothetical protein